jgi:cell wall-associated NlpC family hydrolase
MDEDTSTTTIDAATVADTTGVADATVGADAVAVGTPAAAPRVAVSGKAQIATESIVKDGVATVNVTKSTPASVAAAAYAEQMGSADGVRGGDAASRSSERADLGSAASTGGSVSGSSVAAIAMRYVGVPYVYGGTTPNGFDCSGFTAYVYAQLGKHLPHSSGAQRGAGHAVSYKDAKPGDLISTPGHVAIYLGNGKQIDAPRPGKTIQVRNVWQSNPTFIRVH